MSNIKVYALSKDGTLSNCHCPLSKDKEYLRNTFNYQVHGEKIVDLEIDSSFVCDDARSKRCVNCPFNV